MQSYRLLKHVVHIVTTGFKIVKRLTTFLRVVVTYRPQIIQQGKDT